MERKIFKDNLPKKSNRGTRIIVNWAESEGCTIPFQYEDVYGELEIVKYFDNNLIIKYNGETFWDKPIKCGNLLNCKIGYYIGKIRKDFKVGIGEIIDSNNRDLVIIDREYRDNPYNEGKKLKYYKYKCNKCGNEDWILESALTTQEVGCNACCEFNKKPKLGINTIWDTDPWMVDLGVSEEDAKGYTSGSGEYINVKCPDCGNVKRMSIDNIYTRRNISCVCSDGISYPEKFIASLLNQANVKFQTQLNKSTFKWCDKYRYDFYLPEYNCIIEAHGEQHYKETGRGRTFNEEQENDKIKKTLALSNRVLNYIILDCRYSDLGWIKNSVLNSEMNVLFDLSKIDWLMCEKFAFNNIIKEVCYYWDNKEEWETTQTIADNNKWGISARGTIRDYLKKGNKYGWCNYDPKEEYLKVARKRGKNGRKVEVVKDGVSMGMYPSCAEVTRISEETFGVMLSHSKVAEACRMNKIYKNFEFRYV